MISKGKITRKKTDEERDLKLEKAKANRRKKIAPWINTRQWAAIDKLSTIAPFCYPCRGNLESCLADHIEKYPQVWYDYVNDKDFLDMAMLKAGYKEE